MAGIRPADKRLTKTPKQRTPFVLGSQYVLFRNGALVPFHPQSKLMVPFGFSTGPICMRGYPHNRTQAAFLRGSPDRNGVSVHKGSTREASLVAAVRHRTGQASAGTQGVAVSDTCL